MTQQIERIERVAREIAFKGFEDESQSLMDAARELREKIIFESKDKIVVRDKAPERLYHHTLFTHDRDFRTVIFLDKETDIPDKFSVNEHSLLMVLEERPNTVYDRHELIERVFGVDSSGSTESADNHNLNVLVGRLRKRLRDNNKDNQIIRTAKDRGFYLHDSSKLVASNSTQY